MLRICNLLFQLFTAFPGQVISTIGPFTLTPASRNATIFKVFGLNISYPSHTYVGTHYITHPLEIGYNWDLHSITLLSNC